MSRRYFEIVITARQLALLLAVVAVLLLVAFGLGIGVGWQEPVTMTGGPAGPGHARADERLHRRDLRSDPLRAIGE